MLCKNCHTDFTSPYCPNCGQASALKRVDAHYVIHEIQHVLHFDKGITYTVRELLLRPGHSVRQYLAEDRNRLVKPIIFIIVTSLIYTLATHFFHIEEEYVQYGNAVPNTTTHIMQWVQGHYGYANIIMGVFITLWVKIFFRKSIYNFFEILILLCFAMGMGMLIMAVFAILQGILHVNIMQLAGVLGLIYCVWAIGQFFDGKKVVNYFKGLGAYVLGMVTFFLGVMVVGGLVDMI